jgi:hypothetical protein
MIHYNSSSIFRGRTDYLSDGLSRVGVARLLAAHFAASVFIGSMLSHFRQTMFVRPVRSVIAIKRRLQSGHRLKSIETSKPAPAIGTAQRLSLDETPWRKTYIFRQATSYHLIR